MIKPMTSDKYAEFKGKSCPACRSGEIMARWVEGRVPRYEGFVSVRINVICGECGSSWVEIYQPQLVIVGYEELEDMRREK